MKVPKTIDIMGRTYKVEVKPSPTVDGELVDGFCASDSKEICISGALKGEARDEVLLHEILHAALCEAGVSRHMDLVTEECIVDCLSRFMIRTFRVNLKSPRRNEG